MMQTRRKSKAVAAAAAAEHVHDSADDQPPLQITIPVDIDQDALSDLLPGISLAEATEDSVVALYRVILGQLAQVDAAQRELDEARAEIERKDVELDQALQDRETLTKDLESSIEQNQAELNSSKREREELAIANASLQSQIKSLSTSHSTSSSETESLKLRLEDVDREKRELVVVISRLKEESSQRDEEVLTLRSNLKEARLEHQTLESKVRELQSTEASTKFKFDSLDQQLQLAKTECDRLTAELTTKSEEFTRQRRAKHSELAQIQAAHDTLAQSHAAVESTLKALQSTHANQSHQLTQALARVQDLTGQLAEQEAAYSTEAAGLRRLVSMMEERESQAKEFVEGIEAEWANFGARSERREAALKEEIEKERRARTQAEQRLEQLEAVLERVDRGEFPTPGPSVVGSPVTPRRGPDSSNIFSPGMLGLSPTIAMVSKSQQAGKTFTEVYADYIRLQENFAKKSAEYDHMDRTLSAVLAQIEERAPILSQQRAEYERSQSEAIQLATQLAQTISERDALSSSAQTSAQKLKLTERENELLQKQLADLGRQIQSLLREIGRRDDAMLPSDTEVEMIPPEPAENIEAVITNNLVLFRNINGLQEQNQKLLKIVRELGSKMEAEEKDYREKLEREQSEAVREAHEAMQELADQLERQKKTSEVTIQAYVKERDTLRAMLARAEKSGVNGMPNGAMEVSGEGSPEPAKELVDQFDAYRTEMSIDAGKLREESANARREVGQLTVALAKANANIEYLSERQKMAKEQLSALTRDLENSNKVYLQIQDQKLRSEIQCQSLLEDLSVARAQVEQLRNESANLRAEKKIWESVQSRLVDDNKALAMERAHLSDLMGNVQKMHNDLERSGENDRRRLDSQMKMLEGQTSDLRTQLTQERDTIRTLNLQRDVDTRESQSRMDKISRELSKARESLVGAETSKQHLEERVADLTRQLQGNEEKLAVYERRSSTVNGVASNMDTDLPREQQLESEVAELRSALKVAEVDLAAARSHVQQFQEISQANELALNTLSSTHDEYKLSTEAQISKHESEYRSLEEKLRVAQEDLTELKSKYAELRVSVEAERDAWSSSKNTLENTIAEMTASERNSDSDRSLRESVAKELEERAKVAEARYSQEVLTHAESIRTIEALKQQLSSFQGSARDNLSAAETARANLAASESSWKQQKEALEKEIADLNARSKDLASQNAILHNHLESVSSQAARIRQAASSSAGSITEEGETGGDVDTKLSEMRSVVAYLRKEKEIVDLQLELSKQENIRLKSQIEHISQQLEETRATLSEERERAAESATSDAQHAELLEKINQLNILRESNATLRTECEVQTRKTRELETRVQLLSVELDPAKEELRMAQAELQAKDVQLQRSEEECKRWKERNSQLLSKYDRADPVELQTLKEENEKLKAEKEAAEAIISERVARIEALETSVKNHKDHIFKTSVSIRERMGVLNKEKSTLNEKVKEVETQRDELVNEKTALTKQLEEAKSDTVASDPDQAALIAVLRRERDDLLAEKEARPPSSSEDSNDEDAKQWQVEKEEIIKERDEALQRAKVATEQAKKSIEDAKNVQMSNDKFQARVAEVQKLRAIEREKATEQMQAAVAAAVEKTKAEFQSNGTVPANDASKNLLEELETLKAKHQEELKTAVEVAVANVRQSQPTSGSTVSEADIKARIDAAIAEHDRVLASKKFEEMEAATERGRMELTTKLKLKDAQLVKTQNRVKELEAQALASGGLTAVAPPTGPSATIPPANPSAKVTATTPSTPGSTSAPSIPTGPASAAIASTAKPSTANRTPQAPAATGAQASTSAAKPPLPVQPGQAIRGAARGRGVARGRGPNTRGAAPGRGGAPTAPANAAATSGGVGLSIAGAAGKRTREETEPNDDSLAKRLRSAEPGAPTAAAGTSPSAGGAKPVQIRRPAPTT